MLGETGWHAAVRQGMRAGKVFLDSGAHALYFREVVRSNELDGLTEGQRKNLAGMKGMALYETRRSMPHLFKRRADRYAYFRTTEFWKYVDDYASFVKRHLDVLDHYANVDVIHNPELSWEVQKYLENEHGLNPVPVIHSTTPVSWVAKHIEAGYTYIGLGGIAKEGGQRAYIKWADEVFRMVCPPPSRLPIVKLHGFAMTQLVAFTRYPWYSVDSSSWAKMGAYGKIYLPVRDNGRWLLTEAEPTGLDISFKSSAVQRLHKRANKNRHYLNMGEAEQAVVRMWLDEIGVPLGAYTAEGEVLEWGVMTHFSARKIACLKYFQKMAEAVPPYPWAFRPPVLHKGFQL